MAADVIDEYKTDMFQIARETLPQPTLLLLQSQKHAALSCSAIFVPGSLHQTHVREAHFFLLTRTPAQSLPIHPFRLLHPQCYNITLGPAKWSEGGPDTSHTIWYVSR